MNLFKRNIVIVTFLFLATFTATSVYAQNNSTAKYQEYFQPENLDYQPLIDAFFNRLNEGKGNQAIDDLFSETPWQSKKRENASTAKSALTSIVYSSGKMISYKLQSVRDFDGIFVYLFYNVYFEKQPISVFLELYRPKNEWMLFDITIREGLPINIDNYFTTSLVD